MKEIGEIAAQGHLAFRVISSMENPLNDTITQEFAADSEMLIYSDLRTFFTSLLSFE